MIIDCKKALMHNIKQTCHWDKKASKNKGVFANLLIFKDIWHPRLIGHTWALIYCTLLYSPFELCEVFRYEEMKDVT